MRSAANGARTSTLFSCRTAHRPRRLGVAAARLTNPVARSQLVRRTYEEMKYFKLELQNREENFNKNFGAQPRVGVMMPNAKVAGATQKMQQAAHAMSAVNAMGAKAGGGMGVGGGGMGIGGGGMGIGGGGMGAGLGGAAPPEKVPSAGRRRGQPQTNATDPTGPAAVPTPTPPAAPAASLSASASMDPKKPSRERRPVNAG